MTKVVHQPGPLAWHHSNGRHSLPIVLRLRVPVIGSRAFRQPEARPAAGPLRLRLRPELLRRRTGCIDFWVPDGAGVLRWLPGRC